MIELDNGGALDLTVGEYLTSEGVSLAGKGIKPDVEGPPTSRTAAATRRSTRRSTSSPARSAIDAAARLA